MLDHFRVSRFQLTLEAKEPLRLPVYKGSTFRGGFGHAFKKVACPLRCREACQMPKVCVYAYVFETPPPEGAEMLRKYPHAPHPFVIEPPLDPRERYEPGEELQVGLVLIGRALDFLPYFLYTFDELGRIGIGKGRGKYTLREVRVKGGEERVIYRGETKVFRSDFPVLTGRSLLDTAFPGSRLSLRFLTPTRLRYEGHLTDRLEFHILIRNLLRRLSTLSYFHCGTRLDLDFKGLIERAEGILVVEQDLKWLDWERYSMRQETRMKLGGFVGTVTFKGALREFLPFLRLGELTHVGKGTTFGLGQYRIVSGKGGG